MDTLRLVTFSAGGRPVLVRDLQDLTNYFVSRGTLKFNAPLTTDNQIRYDRRYGGARVIGQTHDNATVVWTTIVRNSDPPTALDLMNSVMRDLRSFTPQMLYLEFLAEGAVYPTYFEARGPAACQLNYDHQKFVSGSNLTMVDVTVPVAPLAQMAQMDILDDFSVNSLTDYSFDAGSLANVSIGGGQVTAAANLTTENRAAHTSRGFNVLDTQATLMATVGTTITSFKAGVILRRSSPSTFIDVYVDDNGTNSRLHIDKVIAGSRSGSSTNLASRLTSGQVFWVRGRVEGNIVTAEYFTTWPTPRGTPTLTVTNTLSSSEQTSLVAGQGGWDWIPQQATATLDNFECLPFTYKLNTPEMIHLGGSIPGDAPALADISVGTAYYGGMNSSANLVTNPDFETNTTGWATANIANVHQAATSLTRITTDSYTGAASGQVVVPGTNSYEGVDFLISGTFSAGVPYRFRMRIHAVTASVTITSVVLTSDTTVDAAFGTAIGSQNGTVPNTQVITPALGWVTYEGVWIPTFDRTSVRIATRGPFNAAAVTYNIDTVEVFEDRPPIFAMLGWNPRPAIYNLVGNGDFEVDVDGWSTASVGGITSAATSIKQDLTPARAKYGFASAQIVTPAVNTAGVNYPMYGRWRGGQTYTAQVWASSASSTTSMVAILGASGAAPATGTAQALSASPKMWTVSWTPTTDFDGKAIIAFVNNAATASTFSIDGVCAFEGTTAPTGRQLEGAGGRPPVGIIDAETAIPRDTTNLTTVATSATAARLGWDMEQSTVVDDINATLAWYIDPALIVPDDFADGEVDIEYWVRCGFNDVVLQPTISLSARPEWGTSVAGERFLNDVVGSAKTLVSPVSGAFVRRFYRLGVVTLPVDTFNPMRWRLYMTVRSSAGSTGIFSVDYLLGIPLAKRALGPTGKTGPAYSSPLYRPTGYPMFIKGTQEINKTITTDLRGYAGLPPYAPTTDSGLGGSMIELPVGQDDLLVKLSTLVPDDPSVVNNSERVTEPVTVHVSVTPRLAGLRGA